MMLNKMFTFHYQLNQNSRCKVKFVVNMNRQPKRLLNLRHHRKVRSHITCPKFTPGYPADDAGLTFGELLILPQG